MAQDPKIKKLADGKWRMRWNNGSKSFTAGTRDEVAEFKAALLANGMVDPRTVAAPVVGGRTFCQVAAEYVEVKEARVTPDTASKYRENLRLHVFPVIGRMDINEIRPEHVRKVLARARKRLGAHSLRTLHAGVLYPVFKWAIANEWRERANPCEVTAQELSKAVNEQPVLLADDAPAFLDCAYALAEPGSEGENLADPDGFAGDFFTLLFGAGLRWQEAAALDVASIDWKRRVIVVKQVLRAKVGIARDKGKSKHAFRDVPFSADDNDPLVMMLARRTLGRGKGEALFVTRRGARIYQELAYRLLGEAAELAEREYGLAGLRGFHAFRRGFATALEDREIPEGSLKLVLGHARHTGATAAYVKLTKKQIENIRPYVSGLSWRSSQLAQATTQGEAGPMGQAA